MNIYKTSAIFLDIGGVILTNGWDRHLREMAAREFQIDYEEMNKRHALTFDTFEIGKITLETYLERVVFFKKRNFTPQDFKEFIFSHSESFPDMLELIREFKKHYSLLIVAVSNEGRELMDQRIKKFNLKEIIDCFICSGYVGLRKPDIEIYRLAFDISQKKPQEVIYIDDRPLLAEIGQTLGMRAIQHSTFEQTKKHLQDFLLP